MPSPTPVDYTARAYDDIRQAMIARIATHTPEWRSRSPHDFGIVLIELFAYLGDQLSFYIDRAANESSLQTAILRESVVHFADLLGYTPDEMVPATGSVTFTAAPGRSVETTVPAGTVLQTYTPSSDSSPTYFTTDEDLVIPVESTTGSVGVTQGSLVNGELIGTSSGLAGSEFSLFQTNIVIDSVTLDVVTGDVSTRWSRIDSLLLAGPSDQVYTVSVGLNDVAFVRFGDGSNGLIPPRMSEIRATYRYADGEEGNVASNVITVIAEPVDGVVSVTNPVGTLGGLDRESIDSIRQALPESIRAVNRAVSLDDFESLTKQVVGVRHAKAEAAVYTSVNLYVVPVDGGAPSTALVERIEDWLVPDRTLIGTDVTVLDPTYVAVNIEVDLYVQSTFFSDETEGRVRKALEQALSLAQVDLGMTVTPSDIYRAVLAVPGVDYAEVELLAREDVAQSGTAPQEFDINEVPTLGELTISTTGGL